MHVFRICQLLSIIAITLSSYGVAITALPSNDKYSIVCKCSENFCDAADECAFFQTASNQEQRMETQFNPEESVITGARHALRTSLGAHL